MGSGKRAHFVSTRLPHATAKALDALVKEGVFRNRTEAARSLMVREAVNFAARVQPIEIKKSKRCEHDGKKRSLPEFAIRVHPTILDLLDMLIEEGYFINRSEAARYFIIRGATELIKNLRSAAEEAGEDDVR
jgi:Arc/MetJ-type ribon-helix-helix transcriptional regulator